MRSAPPNGRSRAVAVCLAVVGVLWCCSTAIASSGGAGLTGHPARSDRRAARPSATVFTRTLRRGQLGSDVKKLQMWLTEVGYAVQVTGFFDTATKSAVRRFQVAHRLYPASGSVGNRTSSALATAVRAGAHAPASPAPAGAHAPASPPPAASNWAGPDPIPGFTIGRDDMGVDATARAGAPIYAPRRSTLVQVMRDWYAGEPLLLFRFTDPPAGALSDYWYVAEQIDPVITTIGTLFQAGQRVAVFASSGTGIEIGWGSPTSNSRTLAGATDSEAADPSPGSTTSWGESFKAAFGIP